MALATRRKLFWATMLAAQIALPCGMPTTPAVAKEVKSRPHIDLAFCIDTTGSMQSEIDNVKAKTKEIVAKLAAGKPSPVIRVGLVAYRDRGDEYVTKVFPFSEDIDHVVRDISDLKADGGGDEPESVNEALHVAVHDLKWSEDHKTVKLMFLIGDAGPHYYPNDYDWHAEAKQAISKGIQINTIGCQGLESMPAAQGIDVWKSIAQMTDGKFEPLSYRHEIADASGRKTTLVESAGHLYKLSGGAADDWAAGGSTLAARGLAREVTRAALPMAAAPGTAGGAVAMQSLSSREDNNLTDIVLDATRSAAKKRLNIDFKDK